MPRVSPRLLVLAFAVTPFIFVYAQQTPPAQQAEPTAEQVFKNIQVFKGVPASDLIPAMEFMSASLKVECSDCHTADDYSKDTRMKEAARHMVLMQRDINAKNFNNRTEVTCMTCHGGKEHPASAAIPEGFALRHQRIETPPKPEELFAKHVTSAGQQSGTLVRTGTLTAPNDETHKIETTSLEFIQAPGGKFRMVAGPRKVGSDGMQTWYGTSPMGGEPAFIFERIGRAWYGQEPFTGLERVSVAGRDTVGKSQVVVVRASRPATSSTQELSFDAKSGLLVRALNVRRSSIGTVVSAIDYSNYKKVNGMQVPMSVVVTFAGGEKWIMNFKSAKVDSKVPDSTFKMGG